MQLPVPAAPPALAERNALKSFSMQHPAARRLTQRHDCSPQWAYSCLAGFHDMQAQAVAAPGYVRVAALPLLSCTPSPMPLPFRQRSH